MVFVVHNAASGGRIGATTKDALRTSRHVIRRRFVIGYVFRISCAVLCSVFLWVLVNKDVR